jgi:hypothetical protein
MNLNVLIMLTVVKAFLVIRSTCLSQFPSSDIVRPKCLCSDTRSQYKTFNVNSACQSSNHFICKLFFTSDSTQGRIQVGGRAPVGAHLEKLRRVEGGANIFGVFRVKNHDFTPKKSYFFFCHKKELVI